MSLGLKVLDRDPQTLLRAHEVRLLDSRGSGLRFAHLPTVLKRAERLRLLGL